MVLYPKGYQYSWVCSDFNFKTVYFLCYGWLLRVASFLWFRQLIVNESRLLILFNILEPLSRVAYVAHLFSASIT